MAGYRDAATRAFHPHLSGMGRQRRTFSVTCPRVLHVLGMPSVAAAAFGDAGSCSVSGRRMRTEHLVSLAPQIVNHLWRPRSAVRRRAACQGDRYVGKQPNEGNPAQAWTPRFQDEQDQRRSLAVRAPGHGWPSLRSRHAIRSPGDQKSSRHAAAEDAIADPLADAVATGAACSGDPISPQFLRRRHAVPACSGD